MRGFSISLSWIAVLLAAATAAAGAAPARLSVIAPPVVFGADKATVAFDGALRARKTGQLTAAADIQPGSYMLYGIGSTKAKASLQVSGGAQVFLLKRDHAASQKLYADVTASRAGSARHYGLHAAPRDAGADSLNAVISVVRPEAILGGRSGVVALDGKARTVKLRSNTIAFTLVAGHYDLRVSGAPKAGAPLHITAGELLYLVRDDDALSQKALGDIMYENGARRAALGRYWRSLALDSTQRDLYERYAALCVEFNVRREAITTYRRIVAAGMADGQTYQALGELLLTEKRSAEAQEMFEKAMAFVGEDPVVLAGLGDAKRKAGDNNGAVFAYRKAVRLAPDSLQYRRALADVLLGQKDSAQAVEQYQAFLDRGGAHGAAAYTVGTYHWNYGRYEDAIRYLLKVSGSPAALFDYSYMLGIAHQRLGAHAEAALALRSVANKFPKNRQWPQAVEALIESYMAHSDYTRAEFWVKKYAAAAPRGSRDVAFYQAYLTELKSPAAAQQQYRKNITAFPADHRNHLRLGLLLSANRTQHAQALGLLKQAIALCDTLPEVWLELSRGYRQLGRSDDERMALRVFSAAQPQHAEANARLGELELASGRTGEAVQRLEAAVQAGSDDAQMLLVLARGYVRSGRSTEAIEVLQRASAGAPRHAEIRRQLLRLYDQTGQPDKALAEMKALLEVARDGPTLLAFARRAYEAEAYDDAVHAIEDLRATDPGNTEALMLLARVLRRQDKLAEAIEAYKEVTYNDPSHVHALFERAETHLENSQPMWAEAFYQRALKVQPGHALSVLGLGKVAKLRSQHALYRQHLQRAYAMAPDDPVVRREYELNR